MKWMQMYWICVCLSGIFFVIANFYFQLFFNPWITSEHGIQTEYFRVCSIYCFHLSKCCERILNKFFSTCSIVCVVIVFGVLFFDFLPSEGLSHWLLHLSTIKSMQWIHIWSKYRAFVEGTLSFYPKNQTFTMEHVSFRSFDNVHIAYVAAVKTTVTRDPCEK